LTTATGSYRFEAEYVDVWDQVSAPTLSLPKTGNP
jgi:hypothetical protein